jgi:hypothetical protein
MNRCILFALAFLGAVLTFGQGSTEYGSGLKVPLDSTGDRYIRFGLWNQIWYRNQHNNPGSLINGKAKEHTWDIGARRLRFLIFAQISPRYLILTHFGINNQTFTTGGLSGSNGTGPNGLGKKPQLFFHDVWNEYAIIPSVDLTTQAPNNYSLYVGGGLHYWWGISRLSSASTVNFLTIDAPIINWPLVEFSDQFVRQFGFYAKGKLGKLNYIAAINKPFATNQSPVFDNLKNELVAIDNNGDAKAAITGYFDYRFFDQESNALPYRVGTYVGTRKVFNLGLGFYHNQDGTKSTDLLGKIEQHDITLLGADVFADLPIGSVSRNMAFTAYAVWYNYNFGPNYWRTIGIMNTSSSFNPSLPVVQQTLNGPGDSRVFVGTGDIFYTQAGVLLPKLKKYKTRVQPFAAYTRKQLEFFDEPGMYWDAGFNLYLDGHHAKITTQYSSRPLYFQQGTKRLINGYRGEVLIQLQIFL